MSIVARDIKSQSILPSFSAIHNKKTNWSPLNVTASGWVDASDSESFTVSGSTLTGVNDKSGVSSFEVNGTPTVVSGGLNSLSVFDFSGNSENIINALKVSNEIGLNNYAVLGFDGGKCKEIAKNIIHVPVSDMLVSEDIQMIIFNICFQWIVKKMNSI